MVALPILIFIVFLALILLLAYHAYKQQQQRTAEMNALADRLDWQFSAERDSYHDSRYSQFEVFRRGHSRYAYNTLRGTIGIDGRSCPATMGDYLYRITSGSGKSRSTHTYRFSYLIVDLPYACVPTLFIREEGIFDALAGAFGFDDIDFESSEFSKQFHVKSSDKRFAFDVIHPPMMEFLLTSQPPTIDIEDGSCCLVEGRNRCWSPAEFSDRMEWVRRFFELWPGHLVSAFDTIP